MRVGENITSMSRKVEHFYETRVMSHAFTAFDASLLAAHDCS